MKKTFFLAVLMLASVALRAQYGTVNAILDELEARRGFNQKPIQDNIDSHKFLVLKDFEDHSERLYLIINGDKATYVEVFDDKKTDETTSNVFTGDVIRTQNNVLSFRFDKLEGKKIAMPITKTMLITKQKKILYLVDINTKQRWIDEMAVNK